MFSVKESISRRKVGDVEHYVEQLEELTVERYALRENTYRKGLSLKDFVMNHKCELRRKYGVIYVAPSGTSL